MKTKNVIGKLLYPWCHGRIGTQNLNSYLTHHR